MSPPRSPLPAPSEPDRLHLPGTLRLTLLEAATDKPIEGIAVTLTIFAQSKNDYHLGPPLSDSQGVIAITSVWVHEGLEFLQNLLLSDYATPLHECMPTVNIEIMSTADISNAISAARLYGMENGAPGFAPTVQDLLTARNRHYESVRIEVPLRTPNKTSRRVLIRLNKLEPA